MRKLVCLLAVFVGCDWQGPSGSRMGATDVELKSASLQVRAKRRAFDGAPPVVPHKPLGVACITCHTTVGKAVPTLGIAPANPHDARSASFSNCRQCHVFSQTDRLFVETNFQGILQQHSPAGLVHRPPVIPHATALRANCAACHAGPAARPEIICSHPHRTNCVQCHIAKTTEEERMKIMDVTAAPPPSAERPSFGRIYFAPPPVDSGIQAASLSSTFALTSGKIARE